MAELLSGHFLLLALVTVLPLPQAAGCHAGRGPECDKAPFVPGHNLAGEGFDVVQMRRTGAYVINVKAYLKDSGTCTLCPNRFHDGQLEKLPAAVLDWRPSSRCSKQLSGALHHSVDSLLRSSSSVVKNNWGAVLSLVGTGMGVLGGSHSEMAKFALSQNSADKATFAIHEISCTYYSYRLTDRPQLSTEFYNLLNRLPQSVAAPKDKALYRRLITTYGTHYIHQVTLGGTVRRVTAFRTCLATLKGFSESEIKNCLEIELKMSLGFLPPNMSFSSKCNDILKRNVSVGFYQVFMTHEIKVIGGERYIPGGLNDQDPSESYDNWMNSLHDNPDVVSYDIQPLHQLVEDPKVRENLKSLVTDYIKENRLQEKHMGSKNCSPSPNLDHHCCPLRAGRGTLKLEIHRAAGLWGDYFSGTDAYVQIFYNDIYEETVTVMNDNDPVWDTTYIFGSVKIGNLMRLEVWDRDVMFDDVVGKCEVFPEKGTLIRSCKLNSGVLYFTLTSTCDPHLTGYMCGRYE